MRLSKNEIKNRKSPWRVRWKKGDRYRTRWFSTEDEADTFIAEFTDEQKEFGPALALTEEQRIEYHHCRRLAKNAGLSVAEAVRIGIQAHTGADAKESPPLEEAIAEFVDYCHAKNLRPKTIQYYEEALNRFAACFPRKRLGEFDRKELIRWIQALPYKPNSKRAERNAIRRLFNWAFRTDPPLIAKNPVARGLELDLPIEDHVISCLTVNQAKKTLERAAPDLKGCLALQLFAGIRRYELARMDWRQVKRTARGIDIAAADSKTRKADFIEKLPPNLWAWVRAYGQRSGPIFPKNYDKKLREAYQAAEVPRWPQSVARHTFATYHYALHRDAAWTISILRHEDRSTMFVRKYKGRATKAQGTAFFRLRP